MGNKTFHVKWAGPLTVILDFKEQPRIYMSKEECIALMAKLQEFVEFYDKDFEKILNKETPKEQAE